MINIEPASNIIIAILGLAYPILLQVIARLDEKYESENIASLFKTEWEWKAFKYSLIAALIALLIWALNRPPLLQVDGLNWFINNSAKLTLLTSSIILVLSFFFFVNKVLKYYTPYSIIPYLVTRHEKSNSHVAFFSALADLLLLSIRRKQTNLGKTLSDFFYTAFKKVREEHASDPVVYPDQYYEVVHKAIEELAILKEKRNYLLEHRTSGGVWLIGEMQEKKISDKTYQWLWQNLLLAVRYKQDDLVINHWETCHQYISYHLQPVNQEFDYSDFTFQVSNQEEVEERNADRSRFIEFHYALGGLLLYKKRYQCIHRIFNYTQSQPPKYELLPDSMFEIFDFYSVVRDPYDRKYSWISHQYPFPEQRGLHSDTVVKRAIMSYMALLFLRQYTILPYLITMRPLEFPRIPESQSEIKLWIEGLSFFKTLLVEHLNNAELLDAVGLSFISKEWCESNGKTYPLDFIDQFKETLEENYKSNALNLPVSQTKVDQFKESSKNQIELALEELVPVSNKKKLPEEETDKWYVHGQKMIQSKDAFSDNPEADHLEFDSFLGSVIKRRIIGGFGELLIRKTSKSYLLKSKDLFHAIDSLKATKDHIIVNCGINLDWYSEDQQISGLSSKAYKGIEIYTLTDARMFDSSLFVLSKSSLPQISSIGIRDELIEKYRAEKISDKLKLYSSVLDMNQQTQELINENLQDKTEEEVRKSVLLTLLLSIEYRWKSDIEVIQLKEYFEYHQKGIPTKLEEIQPLNESSKK